MPGLTENTTYDKIGALIPSAVKSSYKIAEALPPKASKAVDVSQFQGVADAVSRYTPTPSGDGHAHEGEELNPGVTTTQYGGSTRGEKFHPGVDIANKIGTAINAYTPGVVQEVVLGKKQGDPGYGNYILVKDPEGNLQRYSHLYGAYVKVGQQIERGMKIGAMGNSGQTYSNSGGTGSHLDFRVKDIYGKYINPERFIK